MGKGRVIKLSSGLRPFVSRVSRKGPAQKAFAELIGEPVGACVKLAVKEGMSGQAIRDAVKACAKSKGKVSTEARIATLKAEALAKRKKRAGK